MADKKLTFKEFSERYFDENIELCSCHVIPFPPCAFCEGAFVKEAYEEYLDEAKERELNER